MMNKSVVVEYVYGDKVYLLTDNEKQPRIVTGFKCVGPHDEIQYEVCCFTTADWFYSVELEEWTPECKLIK